MTSDVSTEFLVGLVRELCKLGAETEWVEFKVDNAEPQEIGEYLSALANSAALVGKSVAYLVWGVDDRSHAIVGTRFAPEAIKVGNEELESWLLRLLTPKINFRFFRVSVDGKNIVILQIDRAFRHPVVFQGHEYIRIGSYKKKLKDFPEKERELWRIFDKAPFEEGLAKEHVSGDDVLKLVDHWTYFMLMDRPVPTGRDGLLLALQADEIIRADEAGRWGITNLGAILFANDLEDFHFLRRKAVRIIQYRDNSRIATIKEFVVRNGYASGFQGLVNNINGRLPTNEVIRESLRRSVPMYPELAVRELVANALVHQDFSVTGAGPMIEIFADRMEVSNPGAPLVATERFLDNPPRSRNEALASMMRRMGVCEERGSGVDKVVSETEAYQLPAPVFEALEAATRAILFSHRPLARMDKGDRVRACYLHACLKHVNREYLTNSSIRARFGIAAQNSATASRIIKDAVEAGVIVAYDAAANPKVMKYVPAWARP